MIYLVILVLILILIFRYDINGKKMYRNQWYNIVLIILIMVAGLRWRLGIDTAGHLDTFFNLPYLWNLTPDDISIYNKPIWKLLNVLIYTYFGKFYVLQLIQASFVNFLYFKYINKHSKYIFTCVLFYYLYMWTNQNMEEMKGAMGIVVCLFGNDYLLEKKWTKAYLLYFIGFLFHPSSILMIIMPLFLFLRLNLWGISFLFLSYILGYIIKGNLGDYLTFVEFSDDTIADKIDFYASSTRYSQQNGNIYFYIVHIFPYIIYSIFSCYYLKKKWKDDYMNLSKFEPFLMIGLAFLIFQMNVQIFYRYVHFYSIYFILYFTNCLISIIKINKLKGKSILPAFLLFLPLFACIIYTYKDRYIRYYPYSSVIERKIDKERELYYTVINNKEQADINEY